MMIYMKKAKKSGGPWVGLAWLGRKGWVCEEVRVFLSLQNICPWVEFGWFVFPRKINF